MDVAAKLKGQQNSGIALFTVINTPSYRTSTAMAKLAVPHSRQTGLLVMEMLPWLSKGRVRCWELLLDEKMLSPPTWLAEGNMNQSFCRTVFSTRKALGRRFPLMNKLQKPPSRLSQHLMVSSQEPLPALHTTLPVRLLAYQMKEPTYIFRKIIPLWARLLAGSTGNLRFGATILPLQSVRPSREILKTLSLDRLPRPRKRGHWILHLSAL